MTIAASAATSLLLRSVEIIGVNRRALGETRILRGVMPIGKTSIFTTRSELQKVLFWRRQSVVFYGRPI